MIKWHNYPKEKPDYGYGTYLCKLDNGEFRKLAYDSVYGWCSDFDDFDYPHFIYDWDLQWVEETPKNEVEWEKLKAEQYEYERESKYDEFWDDDIYEDVWDDDDYWGPPTRRRKKQ